MSLAQFLCSHIDMDIQRINRKHYMETDLYYRLNKGLSSKLLQFKNGIIQIEVIINHRWHKNYNATAVEIANCWKNSYPELQNALGCKVFIHDIKNHPNKGELLKMGIGTSYDAYKGILFRKNYLN